MSLESQYKDPEEPRYTMLVSDREKLIARLAGTGIFASVLAIEFDSRTISIAASVLVGLAAGHLSIRHKQIRDELSSQVTDPNKNQ